ncbi:mitochondrial metalloendopeptidase OMA1-like [Neltuma alba]|uniref:mitochondrial metalloendopeptidase OMA1-like n=1 Tax=Neltuma alba TaxID=207710 RepID=UPI0010A3BD93|nr:mitochondrial metalloendopeptidase OMA1-like [Prosopis alba]
MRSYRGGKLALDVLPSFCSRIIPEAQISQRFCQFEYFTSACKGANSYGFSSYSLISHRLGFRRGVNHRNPPNPFIPGTRRFYYVDRYNVQHFKRRGPCQWFHDPRNVLIAVMVGSGLFITIFPFVDASERPSISVLETVPYTKRTHYILMPKSLERMLGQTILERMKATTFKWKLLPDSHPESIRARTVAKNIIDALQRGVRKEQVWRDEIADEKWIDEKSRKKGEKQRASQAAAKSHLDGLNWEVLVVDEPICNAFCLPGGKIVVYTGLLEHYRNDAELAVVLGHEVGHAAGRHAAEGLTRLLWEMILYWILSKFIMASVVDKLLDLISSLPLHRKLETEADYIGLMLAASAGYDPRVAPTVYKKLGKVTGDSALRDYLSTHPSGTKRAQMLAQAKVMDEALIMYNNESEQVPGSD